MMTSSTTMNAARLFLTGSDGHQIYGVLLNRPPPPRQRDQPMAGAGRRGRERPRIGLPVPIQASSTRFDSAQVSCQHTARRPRMQSRRARLSPVSNAHSDPRLARAGPDTFISAPRDAAGQSPRGAPWRSVLRTEEKESYMYHESVGYKRTYITNKKSGSAFFTIDFVKVTKRRLCNLA